MAQKAAQAKVDLSAFMAVLIMTIGALVILLVANTLIIISNPEQTVITSVIRSGIWVDGGTETEGGEPFPFGNIHKEPAYVDVYPDRIIIYPGGIVVPIRDLERPQNSFERLLDYLSENKDEEYVVLLIRPGSVPVFRHLQRAIEDRGIDLGWELFEAGRPVDYERARRDREEMEQMGTIIRGP